jgi:UDP:flavonoid glycosyltransferase YjiC (YdhE family)
VKVVLTALGTLGDVAPLLAVAGALEALGVGTVVLVNPAFEAYARGLGLTVHAVGPAWDMETIAKNPRYRDPSHVWREVFAPRIRGDFATTLTAIDGIKAAGVVNHFWCHGGAFAAEARGLPWATIALAPLAWLSSRDPSQLTGRPLPRWLLSPIVRWFLRPRTGRTYEPAVRQAARDVGLRPLADRFWGVQRRAAVNIGLWSPFWRGRADDDPPAARIVGFPASLAESRLPPEVETFLGAGEPPVVMGLGSVLPAVAQALYREVAEACVQLGRRVLLVGATREVGDGLRPAVHTTTAAPYAAVFPRACLVLHHGGIGSTADGLRAGRPTLVVPFGNDQYDNAWRVERMRVGVMLEKGRAAGHALRDALRRCLTSPSLSPAAAAVANRIRGEEDGAAAAAREIRRAFEEARPA